MEIYFDEKYWCRVFIYRIMEACTNFIMRTTVPYACTGKRRRSMERKLEGKVAIITGASKGIGEGIAKTFVRYGAKVVLAARGEKVLALAEALRSEGYEATGVQTDVSDEASVEKLVQTAVSTYGTVDILVNNAGITRDNLLMKMSEEDCDAVINTNLKGAFNCMKHIARQMIKQKGGRIINISSVWGIVGASCEVAYSATKGGINAFTKALAKELAPSNIQVNAVACGAIDTEMNQWMDDDEFISLVEEIPAGRLGKAEEVADLVYHLGYKNSYLTGQVIGLDGGWI